MAVNLLSVSNPLKYMAVFCEKQSLMTFADCGDQDQTALSNQDFRCPPTNYLHTVQYINEYSKYWSSLWACAELCNLLMIIHNTGQTVWAMRRVVQYINEYSKHCRPCACVSMSTEDEVCLRKLREALWEK